MRVGIPATTPASRTGSAAFSLRFLRTDAASVRRRRSTSVKRTRDAKPADRRDRFRIEARKCREMTTAFGVVAIGAETRCTRRQQHHSVAIEGRLRLARGVGKILGGVQREA